MKSQVLILILSVLMLLMAGCKDSDPDTIARNEIKDILYDISQDFNQHNIEGIMDHVHQDYLHKSMISWGFNDLWLDRMAQYSLLEIEVLYIDISGDKAIVTSTNTFTSAYETLVLNEPEDNGDISYFIRDNGVWMVYGNQQWNQKEFAALLAKRNGIHRPLLP